MYTVIATAVRATATALLLATAVTAGAGVATAAIPGAPSDIAGSAATTPGTDPGPDANLSVVMYQSGSTNTVASLAGPFATLVCMLGDGGSSYVSTPTPHCVGLNFT